MAISPYYRASLVVEPSVFHQCDPFHLADRRANGPSQNVAGIDAGESKFSMTGSRVPLYDSIFLHQSTELMDHRHMSPPVLASDPDTLGAWELPEELRMLRDTVSRFMEEEVRPREAELPHDAAGMPEVVLAELQAKARALGLWSLQTPAAFGGAGLSVLGQVVVAEEAAKCRMGAFFPAGGAFGGNPPSVLFSGTPEQFERYGRPIVEGSAGRPFTAISEASGGSDPARAIRCRAIRDGDHYVLNGTKLWTTHVGKADWGIVYARTGEQGKRGGISCFIVDINTPGLSKKPIGVMTSYSPHELHFDNVRIPAENLIGEEGQGFSLASNFLVRSRISYAAGPIG